MTTRMELSPTRERVLKAFQANPTAQVFELAQVVGASWSVTCYHLKRLEDAGLIVRPKIVRRYVGRRVMPNARKKQDLQQRLDAVVSKAQDRDVSFRTEELKLTRLGGCRCG